MLFHHFKALIISKHFTDNTISPQLRKKAKASYSLMETKMEIVPGPGGESHQSGSHT